MTRPALRAPACLLVLLLAALVAAAGGAWAQPAGAENLVRVTIEAVTPDVATATGPATLTVTGTVENPGGDALTGVEARLQRAPAVTSAEQLGGAPSLPPSSYGTVGPFEKVADKLDGRSSVPFTISLPFRSEGAPSLELADPGVYPVLLNLSGTTSDGTRLRLSATSFLLPVVGLPRAVTEGNGGERAGSAVSLAPVAPKVDRPPGLTVLWPLAEKPLVAAGGTGDGAVVRLVDEELATALAPGGHLDAQLAAVEGATSPQADPDRMLTDTLCLAVDPDLLLTVEAMARGYEVATSPADPAAPARAGDTAAAASAAAWLERLRVLAPRMCVLALPFAQVDIEALARLGRSNLTARALTDPAAIVGAVLRTAPLADVTWPDSGLLSEGAADLVAAGPQSAAVVAASTVAAGTVVGGDPAGADPVRHARVPVPTPDDPGRSLAAVLFDVTVSGAFAGLGKDVDRPSYLPGDGGPLVAAGRLPRRQAALGALVWTALERNGNVASADARQSAADVLVAPPQQWNLSLPEATGVLGAVRTLLDSGLATPLPLAASVGRAVAIPADKAGGVLQYPERNEDTRVPDESLHRAADAHTAFRELASALVEDPQSALTPSQFLAPLRDDLIRSLSGSERRLAGRREAADKAAADRATAVTATLGHLNNKVTVLNPGGEYTVTSAQSRLLLIARNDLPVAIDVRLRVQAPPGVQVGDVPVERLPPRGYRQLSVPIDVAVSRQFAVDAQLLTPEERPLGKPVRLSVTSKDYARVMTIVTACAAGLLLLLAGRRLWHRFRGQPDRADKGHEGPSA